MRRFEVFFIPCLMFVTPCREDSLIQEVIKSVVHQRDNDDMGDHLTDQDIFFREVSQIY